jgi:hypothetical protein
MKKNRFTGWSDGEIAEYIRIEKSNHATTCGFWSSAAIAFSFVICNPDRNDSGIVFFFIILIGIGTLCFYSVEKGKKELLELERRQRKEGK